MAVRTSSQRHLHEDLGTPVGHWRKALGLHAAKASPLVQVNSILEADIAAEEERFGADARSLLDCVCSSNTIAAHLDLYTLSGDLLRKLQDLLLPLGQKHAL